MGICRKIGNGVCRTWFREFIFTLVPCCIMALILVLMYSWQEQHKEVTRRIVLKHSLPPLADTVRSAMEHTVLESQMLRNLYSTGTITDTRDTYREASLVAPYLDSLNANTGYESANSWIIDVVTGKNDSIRYERRGGKTTARVSRLRKMGSYTRTRTTDKPFQSCGGPVHDPHDTLFGRGISIKDVVPLSDERQVWWVDPANADRSPQYRFNVTWHAYCALRSSASENCDHFTNDNEHCTCVPTQGFFSLRYSRRKMNKYLLADVVCSKADGDSCEYDGTGTVYKLHVVLVNYKFNTVVAYNNLNMAADSGNSLGDYSFAGTSAASLVVQARNAASSDSPFSYTSPSSEPYEGSATMLDYNLMLISLKQVGSTWNGHNSVLNHVRRALKEQESVAQGIQAAASLYAVPTLDDWGPFQTSVFSTLLSQRHLIDSILHIGRVATHRTTDNPDGDLNSYDVNYLLFSLGSSGELQTSSFYNIDMLSQERFDFRPPTSLAAGGASHTVQAVRWAQIYYEHQYTQMNVTENVLRPIVDIFNNRTADHSGEAFDPSAAFHNGSKVVFFANTNAGHTCSLANTVYGSWEKDSAQLRNLLQHIGTENDAAAVAIVNHKGELLANSGETLPPSQAASNMLWDAAPSFSNVQRSLMEDVQGDFGDHTCDSDDEKYTCDLDTKQAIAVTYAITEGFVTNLKVDVLLIGEFAGEKMYMVLLLPGVIIDVTSTVEKVNLVGAVLFAFIFLIVNIIAVIYSTVTISDLKTLMKSIALGNPESVHWGPHMYSSNAEIRSLQVSIMKVKQSLIEFKSFVPSVVFQGDGSGADKSGLLASAIYNEAEQRVDGDDAPKRTDLVHPKNATLREKELLVLRMFIMDSHKVLDGMGASSFGVLNGRIIELIRECVDPRGGTLGAVDDSNFDCYWATSTFNPNLVLETAAVLQDRLNKSIVGWITQGFAPAFQMGIIVATGKSFSGFVGPTTERSFIIGGELMLSVSNLQRTLGFLQRKAGVTQHQGLRTAQIPCTPCLFLADAKCSQYASENISLLPLFNPMSESPCFYLQIYDPAHKNMVTQYSSRYREALKALEAQDKAAADSFLTQFATVVEANNVVPAGHPVVEYLREEISNL